MGPRGSLDLAAAYRLGPAAARGARRALPAAARRRPGRRGAPLDGPGLPLRGRAGLARVYRRNLAAPSAVDLHRPWRVSHGPADPEEDAPALHPVDPGGAPHGDAEAPARADPARARG